MVLRSGIIPEERPRCVQVEVNQEENRLDDENKDGNSASHAKGSSKKFVKTRFSIS
jgi:hypothetical protein